MPDAYTKESIRFENDMSLNRLVSQSRANYTGNRTYSREPSSATVNGIYGYTPNGRDDVNYGANDISHNNLKKLGNAIYSKTIPHTLLTDNPFRQTVPGSNPGESYQQAVGVFNTQPVLPGIHTIGQKTPAGAVRNNNTSIDNVCKKYNSDINNNIDNIHCDVFDKDISFNSQCGMCLKPAQPFGDSSYIGGMYIDPSQKQYQYSNDAVPSIGKCQPGYFALDASQCRVIKAKMACEGGVLGEDCGICVANNQYSAYPSTLNRSNVKLFLKGSGTLKIYNNNNNNNNNTQLGNNNDLKYEPGDNNVLEVTLNKDIVAERRQFILEISGNGNTLPFIAGYFTGPTLNADGTGGSYTTDLARLIYNDNETQSKPRITGFIQMNTGNDPVTAAVMASASGKNIMRLPFTIPYEFIDTSYQEAKTCSGPIVRTQESAEELGLTKCKTVGAGGYSQECLQDIFIKNGCTSKGSLYPTEENNARLLNKAGNESDSFKPIGDIINYVKSLFNKTMNTGVTPTEIAERADAINKCFGSEALLSADSIPASCLQMDYDGTPTAACLTALYNDPRTYTAQGETRTFYSLNSSQQRVYCRPQGTLSPENSNTTTRATAVEDAKKLKTIDAIRKLYRDTNIKANQQVTSTSDSNSPAIAAAITRCYGLAKPNQQSQTTYSGFTNYTKESRGNTPYTMNNSMTGNIYDKYAAF
jgi:hypothetical protein